LPLWDPILSPVGAGLKPAHKPEGNCMIIPKLLYLKMNLLKGSRDLVLHRTIQHRYRIRILPQYV